MPERTRQLHKHLGKLLEELRSVEHADAVAADLPELEKVQAELDRILAEPAGPPDSDLVDWLRAELTRFEERHPQLTLLTGRVAKSLSDMGL